MSALATAGDVILYFADYEHCHEFMVSLRWSDRKVKCPMCGAEKVTYLARNRVWKCYANHPRPRFSLKTGTIFEDSAVGLIKWLPAVWMLLNAKNGISSGELHRALGVTQKTAWFMLHRIRLAMQNRTFNASAGAWMPAMEEGSVPPMAAQQFENTPEFRRLKSGMKQLLKVTKKDLDRRVMEAKLNSERLDNPAAPGRKRKASAD
jgi:transposase-like protein